MKLTCAQMDVLISFYIDGDLSTSLKAQVEEHIKSCATCRAKFEIIKSMLKDLKQNFDINNEPKETKQTYKTPSQSKQYTLFKNDLSAYIDNELSSDENVKIKKFTINNSKAREDLQDCYNIRKLMNDSFKKTKTDTRQDFSRNVLRLLELDDEKQVNLQPAIKLLIFFTITVVLITALVLSSFSI